MANIPEAIRPMAGGDAAVQPKASQRDHISGYRLFSDMPVPIVLLVLWLVGAAILGACGLTLYALVWSLA